jgi:hypothetical protein
LLLVFAALVFGLLPFLCFSALYERYLDMDIDSYIHMWTHAQSETKCVCAAEFGHGAKLRYGMCGMQGWRRTMEDSHICTAKLRERDDMSMFGVFDGHGGAEVAQFCAKYFIRELVASESFQNGDFDHALKQGFHKMDSLLSDDAYAHEIATVCACHFAQYCCNVLRNCAQHADVVWRAAEVCSTKQRGSACGFSRGWKPYDC